MGVIEKVIDLIKITRPLNGFMMGVAAFIGAFVVMGFSIDFQTIIIIFIIGFTLNGASMIVNDYVDRSIDLINRPDRPLVKGTIKPDEALSLAVILTGIGIFLSSYLGLVPLIIAVIALIVSLTYNIWGKKMGFIGNLMVAFDTAIPFIFGGSVAWILTGFISNSQVYVSISYIINLYNSIWVTPILLGILAFLSNVGREIVKGIADISGDRMVGIKTIAIVYGSRTAGRAATAFILSAVALSPLPYVFGLLGVSYIIVVMFADIIFIYYIIKLLKNLDPKNAYIVKNGLLKAMLLSLIAFVIGRVI
ncbi:MAG: UbiA family prenyltransferase [Thermoprotei archaeon]